MLKLSIYIKNPRLILSGILMKIAVLFPDKLYIKYDYFLNTGKKLNLKNPQTFSEKLQWLKLYNQKPEYTKMVDKVAVKEYVGKIIGEKYIIPTLGIWKTFDKINFEKLPNQFVLKTTHDSGGIVICKDKNTFNAKAAKKKLNRRLKQKIYYKLREWPYKNVNPQILAERYMANNTESELKDYKFFCFNGEVKFCQVIANRSSNETIDFYDINWKHQEFMEPVLDGVTHAKERHNKPKQFKEMIDIATILSKDTPFLRIDLYEINGNIFFGEITFFPTRGMGLFSPEKWNHIFGNWIKLPNKKYCE
jgi:hypothetical protein